ncbi:ATP-dependent Clp protease protease subunit [Roseimicrobium gellanilyticum]|uniref:ATP-dependent Clp protease protease subunit n=1 Tax=Roseimicrobium gellanilyticum TaxID=748857 RepID=A0A366HMW3_9BACT|nr:ATP-dependent Clp protease proteolytic subunit [Roseimicrobium gellanilyticum]RBP44512.1 ATP-dependent Clp protease protease subunit [Roseimicrobium gellanilyticum]
MRPNKFIALVMPLAVLTTSIPVTVSHAAGLPPGEVTEPVPQATPAPVPTPDPLQAMRDEVQRLSLQKEKLTAEVTLAQATLDKELSESKLATARLQAELDELKARKELKDYQDKTKQDQELAALKKQFEKVTLESNIAKAEAETQFAAIRSVENAAKLEIAKLASEIDLDKQQAESRNYALKQPIYLKDPFQGNKLVLSDRRIPLNGPITMASADQIVARINYFNNRDRELPMFIVIDDSPGGSVMAGYKILKAMKGSEAPVYVVVKSFAASMAACLTTLAEKSYAYPNAVILHHQISGLGGGNLTQQQEWVKEMNEWWRRLAEPVAQKMGVTREEFIKQMYAHASTGDWSEFADEAQKLKWVDMVVEEIEETGLLMHPDVGVGAKGELRTMANDSAPATGRATAEVRDEKGRLYMSLPRLNPMDCYWMYNPDGYYRAE